MELRGPVLITGATGFAGGHLVESLAGSQRLVGWGRSTPRPEIARLMESQAVDLLDREQVRHAIASLRPATIFHLAGAPQVAESWRDTTTPLAGNVLASSHLFDAIRRAGLGCRVLVTGSAAVYAPSDTPIKEEGTLAPGNPYALSKLAQEQLTMRAWADDGLNVVLVRPFNHTGPRQPPAFVAPSMARQIALIEKGDVEPVIRVGNLDARRDFTDVRDVVRAYVSLAALGRSGEIYNVGSGVGRSIQSLLDALTARARAEVRVEVDPERLRPSETSALVADTARLRDRTGWTPQISFESMLDSLLDYWRADVRTK
ncbi:MAG TPA: GDP-mannose 4,6-dehydratase [Vicinamibacterales bacterium]|nr:GDP-mannose 4,6-dehydratase [Vicinamibacterales bacterium]